MHPLWVIKCCFWMFPTKDIAMSGGREEHYNARSKLRSTRASRPVLALGAPKETLKKALWGWDLCRGWTGHSESMKHVLCSADHVRWELTDWSHLQPFACFCTAWERLGRAEKSRLEQAIGHHFFFASIWPKPFWGSAAIPTSAVGRRAHQSQLCLCAIILHLKKPVHHCFISSSGEPNIKALPVSRAISSAPCGQDKPWEQRFW